MSGSSLQEEKVVPAKTKPGKQKMKDEKEGIRHWAFGISS
jgi:hypothetical protein